MPVIFTDRNAARFRLPVSLLATMLPVLAAAQDAPPLDPFANIPNVTFKFYDVTGKNEQSIAKSLSAQTLRDPSDGKAGFGLTYASFAWRWSEKRATTCIVTDVSVEFRADVTLPRLVDEDRLPSALRHRWQIFIAALRKHEAGHAQLALNQMRAVKSAILSSTCGQEDNAAKSVLASVGEAQTAYDTVTAHGRLQGATFP